MKHYISSSQIDPLEKISIQRYVCNENEEIHTHEFIEIAYIYEGSGYQKINSTIYNVERGDILFFNFKDSHSIQPKESMGIVNVIFNPDFFSKELVDSKNALDILSLTSFKDFDRSIEKSFPIIRVIGKNLIELETLIDLMLSEFQGKKSGYMTVLESYAKVLLIKIFRASQKRDRINVYKNMKKIAPDVLEYIKENHNKKITLTELARKSFYNPSYFSKRFKECYGMSVTEYINDIRIKEAISCIQSTNDTIESICYHVGFSDKKQFYKHFKLATGMTPEVYRNWNKKNTTNT